MNFIEISKFTDTCYLLHHDLSSGSSMPKQLTNFQIRYYKDTWELLLSYTQNFYKPYHETNKWTKKQMQSCTNQPSTKKTKHY